MDKTLQPMLPQRPDVLSPLVGADEQQHLHGHNAAPLQRLHSILRGRYLWALLLTAIGATAGGFLGYGQVELLYRSEGQILIEANPESILYELDQTTMFKEYVATQMGLLKSQRVTATAMEHERWRRLGRHQRSGATELFGRHLTVERDRQTGMILVTYTDTNAVAAQTAVEAVIRAYMRLYGDKETAKRTVRLQKLNELSTKKLGVIDSLANEISNIAGDYGPDALLQMMSQKLEALQRAEMKLQTNAMALVEANAAVQTDDKMDKLNEQPSSDSPAPKLTELSVDQIAAADAKMLALVNLRDKLSTDLEVLRRLRLLDNHKKVVPLKVQLEQVEARIKKSAKTFNDVRMARNLDGTVVNPALIAAQKKVGQLTRERLGLEALFKVSQEEAIALGKKNVEIKKLVQTTTRHQLELTTTQKMMEMLNAEFAASGRIDPISFGMTPMLPVNKGKRRQVMILGSVGGGALGLGIILLIGLLDRRLRNSEDVRFSIGHMRLLGILPKLDDDLGSDQQATMAGYAVHHIRTLLQLADDRTDAQVLAITSPTSQTGKTSLTLALGLSFAASDSRTLLIDCDLAGGGLSTRLRAIIRRKVGQILLRKDLVSAQQLEEALKLADASGDRLGETLVAMGALAEDALTDALALQEDAPIGLLDALEGESLDECVAETGTPGLFILPIGGAQAHDMRRMSPVAFRRLIAEARQHYDTILLDTGPVPGSVETSIVAPEADQVVLIISRGDQKQAAERAVVSLDWIGANVSSWVFNRAETADIERSMYSTSLSMTRPAQIADDPGFAPNEAAQREERFGPVARAVAGISGTIAPEDDEPSAS